MRHAIAFGFSYLHVPPGLCAQTGLSAQIIRVQALQAELSGVKMYKNPTAIPHDRTQRDGSIVGRCTWNSLPRSQPKMDFNLNPAVGGLREARIQWKPPRW